MRGVLCEVATPSLIYIEPVIVQPFHPCIRVFSCFIGKLFCFSSLLEFLFELWFLVFLWFLRVFG